MNGAHARPMTAYAALCAAAVVVLAQGVGSSSHVADAVAHAGRPVSLYAHTVTLAAAEQVQELGRDLGAAVASTIASTVAPVTSPAQQPGSATRTAPARDRVVTTQVAPAVSIAPATGNLRVAPSSGAVQQRAAGHHKAGHAAKRDARTAHRASAGKPHGAHRAAARGHR